MRHEAGWWVWLGVSGGVGATLLAMYHWLQSWRAQLAWDSDQEGEIVLRGPAFQTGQAVTLTFAPGNIAAAHFPGLLVTAQSDTLSVSLEVEEDRPGSLLAVGAEAVITLPGPDAVYRCVCRVRDARKDTVRPDTWRLILGRPRWMARVQRRRHARVRLALPATLEHFDTISWGLVLPFTARLIDLSPGGFRARVGAPCGATESQHRAALFARDTIFRVRLPVPALAESALYARVTHCERKAVRGGIGLEIAAQFLPLQSWEETALIEQIHQCQRLSVD